MYKGSLILGKTIVAYGTGERVGRVKDLIFDHQSNRVLGLLVDEGGLFGKVRVVSVKAVQSIGLDAVIITAKEAIVDAEQAPEMQAILDQKTSLKNTQIMTVGGQELGTFLDIFYDEHTWDVVGYEVSGGLFADIYTGRSFVPTPLTLKLGKECAFVENEIADRMEEATGGLKPMIEATGEKLQEITEATGEKIQTTKAVAGEKLQAAQQAAEEKLNTLTESASEQLQTARQAVGSTWQSTVEKTTETVQKALPHPTVEQAQGRRVQRAVKTEDDLFIAAPGQIVTEVVIGKARQYHQEADLLEAVGLTVGEAVRTEAKGWLAQSGKKLRAGTQQVGERLREGLEGVNTGTQHLWEHTKERAAELQSGTGQAIEERRIQGALGRHVSRIILDEQDQVILDQGAIITHDAIERARAANVLPLLLSSVDDSSPRTSALEAPQENVEAEPETESKT